MPNNLAVPAQRVESTFGDKESNILDHRRPNVGRTTHTIAIPRTLSPGISPHVFAGSTFQNGPDAPLHPIFGPWLSLWPHCGPSWAVGGSGWGGWAPKHANIFLLIFA